MEFDRLGVEIGAIGELDPLAQEEGYFALVIADRPGFSQPAMDDIFLVDVDQALQRRSVP